MELERPGVWADLGNAGCVFVCFVVLLRAMKPLLFSIGFTLCALAALGWGLLSMFSPRTLERFMEWYTRADKWSSPKPVPRAEGSISQRISGFLVTLMSLLMIRQAFRFLMHGVTLIPVRAMPPAGPSRHWSALICGVAIIGFGVYVAIRPQLLLRFTEKNFPNRELSPRLMRQALRAGPVVGTLTILLGAYLLFLWYRWTH